MLAYLRQKGALLLSGVLLVGFGFMAGTAITPGTADGSEAVRLYPPLVQPASPAAQIGLTSAEQVLADLYTRVSPSVVSINVVAQGQPSSQLDEGFSLGSGTGFVIDTQGRIVTNYHVIDSALDDGIEVNFLDGTIVRAEVLGTDPDSDLALLRVDLPADQLVPVSFGNSDNLVIGQTAVAIGSPFGQRWTLTTGIISALDRTIQGLGEFQIGAVIQTDAAINPGNSGGPLLNLNGEVIGVNSQIVSRTRSNSGIGFAVPSNLVLRVINELLDDGKVDYSYIGIGGSDVTLALIETLELPNNLRGVVVENVAPGQPASRAGLRNPLGRVLVRGEAVPTSADIITAIDGVPVRGMASLIAYLASNTRPGDTVNLTVYRNGEQVSLSLTLGNRP